MRQSDFHRMHEKKKKNQIAASATFLTPNLPVIEYTRLKIKIVKNREI